MKKLQELLKAATATGKKNAKAPAGANKVPAYSDEVLLRGRGLSSEFASTFLLLFSSCATGDSCFASPLPRSKTAQRSMSLRQRALPSACSSFSERAFA